MTSTELKALRRFFFLDVVDAASYVGNCSARAWQHWESGNRKIPADVIDMMNKLKEERKEILFMLCNKDFSYNINQDGALYDKLLESAQAELLAKM